MSGARTISHSLLHTPFLILSHSLFLSLHLFVSFSHSHFLSLPVCLLLFLSLSLLLFLSLSLLLFLSLSLLLFLFCQGMERLALLLVNGRGVPQKDAKRAVQLMVHAISQISSGQSKTVGVQAILKQVVLTYRIVFTRLYSFLGDKLSLSYASLAVLRVKRFIAGFSIRARFTPEDAFQVRSLVI